MDWAFARTVCVYFDSPHGRFGHVTSAPTLFAAVADALDWFMAPFWKGPRPDASTIFEVTLVGD
jgi:hypothetical protein